MNRVPTDQQVIDALAPLLCEERVARIDRVISSRQSGIVVVLEHLHDPHNGAAVLRSAESQGVLEVHHVGDSFRFSDRVTQGADKWLRIERQQSIVACTTALKARGFVLCAAVPGAPCALESLDPSRPTAFLFGNEHAGLSLQAREQVDVECSLGMHGFSESLNLSVACAITLYTHARLRREALGQAGDLSPAERVKLRAEYYRKDVRGAEAIIARMLSEQSQK